MIKSFVNRFKLSFFGLFLLFIIECGSINFGMQFKFYWYILSRAFKNVQNQCLFLDYYWKCINISVLVLKHDSLTIFHQCDCEVFSEWMWIYERYLSRNLNFVRILYPNKQTKIKNKLNLKWNHHTFRVESKNHRESKCSSIWMKPHTPYTETNNHHIFVVSLKSHTEFEWLWFVYMKYTNP